MHGITVKSLTFTPFLATLIPDYTGKSTVRASPLIVTTLGNTTIPQNGTLYLQSATNVSDVDCGPETPFTATQQWRYSDTFLRHNLAELPNETAYNLTFLDENELIVPIVDCTAGSIMYGDDSSMRVFYLMRDKIHTETVSILTWTMSTQEYKLKEEFEIGASAASMTLTFISDFRDTSVTHYHITRLGFPFQMNDYQPYTFLGHDEENLWVLESFPEDPAIEATKVASTTCRWGFFVNALTEQCNIKNLNWDLSNDPTEAISVWPRSGYSVIRDSWAWVHAIHLFFAADALFNLIILLTIVYRKAREGKFWLPPIFVFDEIIHADLLTLYLGLAGLLGALLRERIDPALVVILYEVGYQFRQQIAIWRYAHAAQAHGHDAHAILDCAPSRAEHPSFIAVALFPSFATFALIILYVSIRKVYFHFFPPHKIIASRAIGTGPSVTENSTSLSWRRTLTVFEIATGAPLQNRIGLVSDYDNCVFIKGMKFASADGIYRNGFVIANGKWLIATDDLLSIVIVIVTRVRFRNVYAYEVDGHTVQHTARLIYPQTMTLKELLQLNINTLT